MPQQTLEGFRLSPQQKHLWTLQQIDGESPYRVQCAILIEGNLNKEIFKEALQTVINRHEILRTNFQCLPGMTIPLQVIANNCFISVYEHDLRGIAQEEQDSKIEFLFQDMSQPCFDGRQGSAMSASLVTLSPQKHVLLLGLSAMNADSGTLINLVSEIGSCYSACVHGKELSDEPIQYADLAEWQYELLESEDTAIAQEYWRKVNLDIVNNLSFPFRRKAALKQQFKPEYLGLQLNNILVEQIESLANWYGISTSTLLLACWQVLIWKLTRQVDSIIGLGCNGRKYEDLEQALGLLSKDLPLNYRLEDELKFSQVLAQADEAANETYKWQEYFHWENFIEADKQEQVLPYFPICFDFKKGENKYCGADVVFSIYKEYDCTNRFQVKLVCIQNETSLNAEFHYDVSLFDSADIKRLSKYFETLLESAVNHPEAAIGKLEILCDRDRHQLLFEFNNTQTDYPKNKCIHQLFEKQAEQTPDNVAIVIENQQLTYRELNERANQIAHYLQKLGVKPEALVGICVERSLEMIVAMLGILKAGGAYVPLDPAMPMERLALMLQDAQVSVLLTQQHFTNQLAENAPHIVCLDSDWSTIAQQKKQNCSSTVTSQNIAYIIYTSGSTGTPKGVVIEHQQLLNYLNGILPRLGLSSSASFATVSTFAADLGNTAIFPALCSGGCLHVISQERATDAEALAEYFRRYPIDCLKIVPSHLAALLTSSNPELILPRQRLILGGEAASWDLIGKIQQHAPNCLIINHYGPTETTVGVLTYLVDSGNLRDISDTVPLGRPILNTQIYILDAHQQPVPIGVVGEIYIGGDSLARGYLNQPQFTAEKFIANPFTKNPQARIYKTGDLARYLPDGNIEFLGRVDHQVKIRGFRIELGEIEAVIRQHPEIEQAVVIVREDASSDQRIVAYIVPNVETLQVSSVREFLKQKFPDYMIPSAFVKLKTLPLTPNGKVARQALPAPDKVRPEGTFVAPRNSVEETLVGIWAEVLKIEQLGIYDNFFELGGHSLLATQVISRIRQSLQIDLPLHHLFESPTIVALSVVIAEKLAAQADEEMLARMVAELEQLSEEEVQKLLANEGASNE